jgi:hypothetical protein
MLKLAKPEPMSKKHKLLVKRIIADGKKRLLKYWGIKLK